MNKAGLIDAVQAKLGGTRADAERAVATVLDEIKKGLQNDGQVQLVGFGTFLVKQRAARTARNPRTGAPVSVPASRTVGFKVGKALKESV